MSKSVGKLTYHLDAKLNILPFLKSRQTNTKNCLLSKLFVDISFVSKKQIPMDRIAKLDEELLIFEIAKNVDWLKQNFKISVDIQYKFSNPALNKRFEKILFKGNLLLNTKKQSNSSNLLRRLNKLAQHNKQKHCALKIETESGCFVPLFILENDGCADVDGILAEYINMSKSSFSYDTVFGEINSIDALSALLNLDNPLNHLVLDNNLDYYYTRNYNSIDATGSPVRNWHLGGLYIDSLSSNCDNIGDYINLMEFYEKIDKLIKLSPKEVFKKFQIDNFNLISCLIFSYNNCGSTDYSFEWIWQGNIANLNNTKDIDNYIGGFLLKQYLEK